VSLKLSPSGEAPAKIMFVRHSNPPMAYITTMYDGGLYGKQYGTQTEKILALAGQRLSN
jgi:hypothetical protein